MEKYKNFLGKNLDLCSAIVAILCALFMLIVIVVDMSTPLDFSELEHHYSQLEMIKKDDANLCNLKNADISIDDDGMVVTLKGTKHNLKANFDKNNNYLNATVTDNRIGSNIIVSGLIIFAAGGLGILLSYVIWALLYIPVLVYAISLQVKNIYKKIKNN